MRISIVICNYNYDRFLDDAIRSALAQTWSNKEVIVVDDGSTDGSREIIARWKDQVLAVFKDNGGQVSAYNAGFEQVTGDVVVFQDADDVLDGNACERVAAAFTPEVVKVHFRLRLIDDRGVELGVVIPSHLSEGFLADHLRLRGELYQSAPGSGNAYRVSTLRRLMPIVQDPSDRHGADFFTVYAISLLGHVRVAAREPLGSYRVHRPSFKDDLLFGNASNDLNEPVRMYRRYERMRPWVAERLGGDHALPPNSPGFSQEKQGYALTVFAAESYVERFRTAGPLLADILLPAIARRPGPWTVRAGLVAWAVGLLVLPRRLGLPMARYICNPASR